MPRQLYSGYADAAMKVSEARVQAMLSGEKAGGLTPVENVDELQLTTENLSAEYPQHASSLFNLIQQTEKNIQTKSM